jgi:leucyl aminopeptidase
LKDEFVVIGGHYDSTKNPQKLRKLFNPTDSINNGADDNASGTSMVLELFEKFASTNDHKRTLYLYYLEEKNWDYWERSIM